MCGIAGWLNDAPNAPLLRQMLHAIRHRGPESQGAYADQFASLGHARLSIVDVEGGRQPLTNEDETIWVIVNGEIYNHHELRAALQRRGHQFRTRSDCEVITHLYEEKGVAGFAELNGQYAFALWDSRTRKLVLCRDRFGICPLFYTVVGDRLYFASEIKALLQSPEVKVELDYTTLGSIWTYWSPLPGRTMFRSIHEFPAAHHATVTPGQREVRPERYWRLDFTTKDWSFAEAKEALAAALDDAVRIRLQADVPVGAYLSGGLDSSVLTSLAMNHARELQTFSIAFDAPEYDESAYQSIVAQHLGTQHHVLRCDRESLAAALPEMVRHAEAPQLRAGPLSMLLLAANVHEHDFKVVVTGEGADELFMGYDIFRETAVRRFMARDTTSRMRKRLTRHLYTYLPDRDVLQRGLELTFQQRLDRAGDPLFSHDLRWSKAARLQSYFTAEARAQFDPAALQAQLQAQLPPGFETWHWAGQAQALEITTFLSSYLLAAQGDRMAMASAVEGRFPFLDHRVVELANSFPMSFKLRTLRQDKYILRQLAAERLPETIAERPKLPYRAPIREVVRSRAGGRLDDLLSVDSLRAVGLFAPEAARRLYEKVRTSDNSSEMEEMALFGVITTQLWHELFLTPPSSATTDIPSTRIAANGAAANGVSAPVAAPVTARSASSLLTSSVHIITSKDNIRMASHATAARFNAAREAERLISWMRDTTHNTLKRDGAVVGVSGGVDSATVLYLAARAFGANRVVALLLPDRDSSPDSARFATEMATDLGVETITVDLTAALQAFGCYERRDDAVKRAVPAFDPRTDKIKIVLPQDLLGGATLNVYSVVVIKPDGEEIRRRLNPQEFREIVAASNLKQRARMMTLYQEAERRNYVVMGTGNKNEHDLGFFVKYGDGGIDMMPMRHLFKTQVYGVAEYVGVPQSIRSRPPTTDTYSAECTQEEFFYRLPFDLLDAIWDAGERGDAAEEIAARMNLSVPQVENALYDVRSKRLTTEYLRQAPLFPPPPGARTRKQSASRAQVALVSSNGNGKRQTTPSGALTPVGVATRRTSH